MPDTLFQLASLSLSDKMWVVVCLGLIFLLVWINVYFLLSKRQAAREQLLLDAGLDRYGAMEFLGGIFMIWIGVVMFWDDLNSSFSLLAYLSNTVGLLAGVLLMWTGTFSTIFTSNRIFSLRGNIPWGNVQSYTWVERNGPVLMLQLNRRWFFQRRTGLTIPPRHRQAVQAILEQRVGKTE